MFRVLCTVLFLVVALASTAAARTATPANEVAAQCHDLDAREVLKALGVNRGDCVNLLRGPASAGAANFYAAACGYEPDQGGVGATNRGQCLIVLIEPGND